MSLQLFAHPFSAYCQKVLIRAVGGRHGVRIPDARRGASGEYAPSSNGTGRSSNSRCCSTTAAGDRDHGDHRASAGALPRPQPLDSRRRAGPAGALPRPLLRPYVMNNMTCPVFNALRPEESRDPYGVEKAMERLRIAYDWLEANLGDGPVGGWRTVHAGRLCRRAVAVLRRLGRGDRPVAAAARRLSRAAAGPSGRRASSRRGPALPQLLPAWAHPTATDQAKAAAPFKSDRPRSPRRAAFRSCGCRRCGRGGICAPAWNSAAVAQCGRHRRAGRARPAHGARPR